MIFLKSQCNTGFIVGGLFVCRSFGGDWVNSWVFWGDYWGDGRIELDLTSMLLLWQPYFFLQKCICAYKVNSLPVYYSSYIVRRPKDLHYLLTWKKIGNFFQIFVAFSKYIIFKLMLALLGKNWIFDFFFVSVPSTSSTDLSTISFENIPNCATSTHAASTSTSGEHFFIFLSWAEMRLSWMHY